MSGFTRVRKGLRHTHTCKRKMYKEVTQNLMYSYMKIKHHYY